MATTQLNVRGITFTKRGDRWFRVVPQKVEPVQNVPVDEQTNDLLQTLADEKDAKSV